MLKQVFVTGVYGSGKTHFAQELAAERGLEYLSFDGVFDYTDPRNQSRHILANLPGEFVMDAIPIDESQSWKDFIEFESTHPVAVICVYCPDRDVWLQRIRNKKLERLLRGQSGLLRLARAQYLLGRSIWHQISGLPGGSVRRILRLGRRWLINARNADHIISEIDESKHSRAYRSFFQSNLPALSSFKNARYFDSIDNVYTSENEMLDRIGYRTFGLRDHLDGADEDYDIGYQDIELIDYVGYSESHKTWENIHDLVDWRGKRVVDLGCFHGYFSFKVEDRGGSAHGLDKSAAVLATARMINELRGGKVVFSEWEGGMDIPDCDVILCLNVLHHFSDPDAALSRMNADTAVFEINRDQIVLLEKHFHIIREVSSHRRDRVIVLCERADPST